MGLYFRGKMLSETVEEKDVVKTVIAKKNQMKAEGISATKSDKELIKQMMDEAISKYSDNRVLGADASLEQFFSEEEDLSAKLSQGDVVISGANSVLRKAPIPIKPAKTIHSVPFGKFKPQVQAKLDIEKKVGAQPVCCVIFHYDNDAKRGLSQTTTMSFLIRNIHTLCIEWWVVPSNTFIVLPRWVLAHIRDKKIAKWGTVAKPEDLVMKEAEAYAGLALTSTGAWTGADKLVDIYVPEEERIFV